MFSSKAHKLHTTRSWEFLGLDDEQGVVPRRSAWNRGGFGENTVIGNIDTGNLSDISSRSIFKERATPGIIWHFFFFRQSRLLDGPAHLPVENIILLSICVPFGLNQ